MNYIDKLIENGEYSSRADYVHTAVRYFHSFILSSLAKFYTKYDEIKEMRIQHSMNVDDDREFIRKIVLVYWKDFDIRDYSDERTSVLIRIPTKLYDDIAYLSEVERYFSSKQDFYRRALEYYVNVSDLHKEAMDAIKTKNLGAMKRLLPAPIPYLELFLEDPKNFNSHHGLCI